MRYLFLIASFCSLVSCSSLLGIKKTTVLSDAEIYEKAKLYNISSTYILDSGYLSNIAFLKTTKMLKHHIQPLQALYFNNKGENLATIINCNASGFTNLNWEKAGDLTVFPPQSPDAIDTVSLSTVLYATGVKKETNGIDSTQYTVVVFWNDFMGRQTKRFLKAIRKNIALCLPIQNSRTIYINNDNFYGKN